MRRSAWLPIALGALAVLYARRAAGRRSLDAVPTAAPAVAPPPAVAAPPGRPIRRRLRSRVVLTALFAASLGAVGLAFSATSALRPSTRHPLDARAPSLASLDRALRLADGFVRPLYRPLNVRWAVMSEYYGFPLRVHVAGTNHWLLLGESHATSISKTRNGAATESFRVAFWDTDASLRLAVDVAWRAGRSAFAVRIRQVHVAVPLRGTLYLDTLRIGTVGRGARAWTIVLPTRRRDLLGSFRYTVRHGAQLSQNYYDYVGDRARYRKTADFIRGHGFLLDADLTAPIWGKGRRFGDDLPYNDRLTYHDCRTKLPSTALAYPYRSKVCSTSRGLYIWLDHSDALGPVVQALHVLERHDQPDRKAASPRLPIALPVGADLSAWSPAPRSPREIATWLEGLYRGTGIGIGRCLPALCETSAASAIRTFEFAALETRLGYRYGDRVSRTYADAIAALALKVQVGAGGVLHTDHGTFVRPTAAGSFYLAWDHRLRAHISASLADDLSRRFNMPAEYTGLVVSNAETTLTAYAFLAGYRCARYGVGCAAGFKPLQSVL